MSSPKLSSRPSNPNLKSLHILTKALSEPKQPHFPSFRDSPLKLKAVQYSEVPTPTALKSPKIPSLVNLQPKSPSPKAGSRNAHYSSNLLPAINSPRSQMSGYASPTSELESPMKNHLRMKAAMKLRHITNGAYELDKVNTKAPVSLKILQSKGFSLQYEKESPLLSPNSRKLNFGPGFKKLEFPNQKFEEPELSERNPRHMIKAKINDNKGSQTTSRLKIDESLMLKARKFPMSNFYPKYCHTEADVENGRWSPMVTNQIDELAESGDEIEVARVTRPSFSSLRKGMLKVSPVEDFCDSPLQSSIEKNLKKNGRKHAVKNTVKTANLSEYMWIKAEDKSKVTNSKVSTQDNLQTDEESPIKVIEKKKFMRKRKDSKTFQCRLSKIYEKGEKQGKARKSPDLEGQDSKYSFDQLLADLDAFDV